MADRRKLAQGLMMMTPSARADIAQQADEFERFKQADYLRKMGEQGAGLAKSVARGVPQMATGLVDLASMPFEAAGVLQPGQAVGSTKWLENRGYLPESQPGFANQLTELLSGGFDPSDLVTKGLPALGMIGKTVWHGSPHGFTKFDMSKIGTGEGAQAYGHGLYLAESPDVAGSYRTAGDMGWFEREADKALYSQDIDNAIASTKKELERVSKEPRYVDAKNNLTGVLNVLEARKAGANEYGSLYKVDLPDEQIAKMLDWDKPLSEQAPEVINAMKNMTNDVISGGFDLSRSNRDLTRAFNPVTRDEIIKEIMAEYPHLSLQNGKLYERSGSEIPEMAITDWMRNKHGIGYEDAGQWIRDMSHVIGSQADVSSTLFNNGIPGIQYLDQASRGAGEGTRNYVVFSDEIPQILERNGQPIAQALREYKQLESLNPTGTVMTEYNPLERASLPLGKNLTTLDVTSGVSPDEMVEIYRGVPQGVSEINPGDFITTNRQLAQDYAGGGNVISQKVPYRTILDDLTEPLGEEYIYRP